MAGGPPSREAPLSILVGATDGISPVVTLATSTNESLLGLDSAQWTGLAPSSPMKMMVNGRLIEIG